MKDVILNIFRAASMKMTVFWDIARTRHVDGGGSKGV
jgi:hypothetical protein